jgi:hypothetical protein
MTFTPTTAQLELLAELEMARMPVAVIADRLGVDGATFKAWTARLDAVRNFEEPPPSNAEIMRKPLVEREHWLRRELTTTPRAKKGAPRAAAARPSTAREVFRVR